MNANDVINRVRNLKEFTVVTDRPEEFLYQWSSSV